MVDHRTVPPAQDVLSEYPGDPDSTRVARAERHRVPVPGGAITMYFMPAEQPGRGLPIVYVPGWGGTIEGFLDVIRSIGPDIDLTYVETREKQTSELDPAAEFTMSRIGADVGAAIRQRGLDDHSYVLLGSSFGGAVALQALADGAVRPATTILYDPMPRLWMPGWVLRYVAPLLSARVVEFLRPGLKRLVLAGMREPTQRRRAAKFIDAGDMRKWRSAAIGLRDWDVFSVASRIGAQVDVVNGCTDRFHDAAIYPAITRAIRYSRFLRIPVPESHREHLMGAVATAYARAYAPVRGAAGVFTADPRDRPVPESLRRFVRE